MTKEDSKTMKRYDTKPWEKFPGDSRNPELDSFFTNHSFHWRLALQLRFPTQRPKATGVRALLNPVLLTEPYGAFN
jgi:hypothetical protein